MTINKLNNNIVKKNINSETLGEEINNSKLVGFKIRNTNKPFHWIINIQI